MSRKLAILGGFYREICRFPRTDEYFGSGGRAAAALGKLDIARRLSTVTDGANEGILASLAHTFGFQYDSVRTGSGIRFEYQHPLATPVILPDKSVLEKVQLTVNADVVLLFGMLEAESTVNAETVIYDPQNPLAPSAYRPKGSKPKRLAYVLNAREARLITESKDASEAAKIIQDEFGADAVAIKEGPAGAFVRELGTEARVPAYKTSSVWPIGSGDVFAAVFAALWGIECQDAASAATAASRAAAFYVESRTLPIPQSVIRDGWDFEPIPMEPSALAEDEYHVYLAGPFFNMAQFWLVEEAKIALQNMGLRVFSPIHEIGMGKAFDVAPKDIEGLRKCRIVLALVDGLDTGTIFEVGFARALGKRVIAFAECTEEESLKMLVGTECDIVNDFSSAIYRAAWASR